LSVELSQRHVDGSREVVFVVLRRRQDLHKLGPTLEESPGLAAIDVVRHLSTLPAPLGTHHSKPPTSGARPPALSCQYLYAGFSLKQSVEEGLTAEQLAAINRWRTILQGIAVQEMLHLALVANLMSAIGAAPTFTRSNFPRRSDFPPSIQLSLLPFGEAALTHFLFLERPEGMERMDAEGFVPVNPSRQPIALDEDFPHAQDYATVGHLYRGIADGLRHLADRLGEGGLFVGSPQAQARPEAFHMPELVVVTDLQSALSAVEEIIEQGEGARGEWQTAHYGRFLEVYDEHAAMLAGDVSFEAARPVLAAFTSQPFDLAEPQPLITDPRTRAVADLFNMGYEVLLQTLTRYFTHTDETPEQLGTLVNTALGLMTGVLRRLGNALTLLPVGPEHPGRTAGPTFQMYYQMGNFVPVREAAWLLLQERVRLLADRCTGLATTDGTPEVVGAARSLERLLERLAAQVAPGMC
jgi:hypothetical protein